MQSLLIIILLKVLRLGDPKCFWLGVTNRVCGQIDDPSTQTRSLILFMVVVIFLTCVLHILFVFFKTCGFQCAQRKIFGTWVAIFVMVVGFHKRRKLFRYAFVGFYYCELVECYFAQWKAVLFVIISWIFFHIRV